mgnify:FL=1|jgi:cell division protein FtsL
MTRLGHRDDRILWTETKTKPVRTVPQRGFFLLVLLLACMVAAALFYVWARIQVIEFGYEISKALKEEGLLLETNKKLRLEIAELKAYGRIEKIAVEQLRMTKPTAEQVVVIR